MDHKQGSDSECPERDVSRHHDDVVIPDVDVVDIDVDYVVGHEILLDESTW